MSCLRKMLRIICLYLILNIQFPFYGATPLIGTDVRIAHLEELPFIVSVSKNTSENFEKEELKHLCGGSLITTSHVLTAAHCLANKVFNGIVVKIGSIDLRKAVAHRVHWWKTFNDWTKDPIPYERYKLCVHDVAIIKILDTVTPNFPLPTISSISDVKDLYEKNGITGGWGRIEQNKKPRYLRIANLFVVHPNNCKFFTLQKNLLLKNLMPRIFLCTLALPTARLSSVSQTSYKFGTILIHHIQTLHDSNSLHGQIDREETGRIEILLTCKLKT